MTLSNTDRVRIELEHRIVHFFPGVAYPRP